MKKKESLKKPSHLKLHRETLLNLETELKLVVGGDYSVQFCTEGCPPTGGA